MLDKFDYMEPGCRPGRIPVSRVLEKADSLFNRNDYLGAGKLLECWKEEAVALGDRDGELSIQSELVGYYRKQGDPEKGLGCISRALMLVEELDQGAFVSGATVMINCATACHAFGRAEEAMPLYRRAEAVYKKLLPGEDARFGGLYNNMALTLVELGSFEEAEQAYANALAVMERVPRGEAECAITYINLAYLQEATGRRKALGESMEKARRLLESPALPRDGYYAFVLEKCAPAFGYFGDEATAARMKKESEEIYARA